MYINICLDLVKKVTMHQAMLCCNGVQTQVITEGRWVEEGLASSGKKDLVLVIPGNPGVPGFYKKFIKYLKLQLPTEVPVWVVGHAGHVQPPKHLAFSSSESSHNNLFSLNGQLRHMVYIKIQTIQYKKPYSTFLE